MSNGNGNGEARISVSREALRAELGALELRIVDRLTAALELKADASTVDMLVTRLNTLELSKAAREHLATDVSDLDKRLGRVEDSHPSQVVADFRTLQGDVETLKTVKASEAAVASYKRWMFGVLGLGLLDAAIGIARFFI